MCKRNILGLSGYVMMAATVVVASASPVFAVDPSGLVAGWCFNETGGVVTADEGPNGYDGTLLTGAGFANGVLGNGVHLDGVDDYVDITDVGGGFPTAIGGVPEGTISMWFKFDRVTEMGDIFPIFYMGDAVGQQNGSRLIIEVGHVVPGNTKLYFTVYADNSQVYPTECYDSDFNLTVGQWYHFAALVGPSGNTGYLDGQEMTDRYYNFADETAHEFLSDVQVQDAMWLGKGFMSQDPREKFFPGTIDEVLVYDRVWSGPEVLDYYNATVPEPTTMTLLLLGAGGPLRRARSKATATVDGKR